MRMIILGAPGSGKATQAKLLAARHRVVRISTRELLDAELLADADEQAAGTSDASPVADWTNGNGALRVLEERLRARNSKRGFIIDDFPEDIPQAQGLDALMGRLGWSLQISVYLNVDEGTLAKRISSRRKCAECGAAYNQHDARPQVRSKCDVCEGQLVSDSGTPRAVAAAVAESQIQIEHLVDYYKAQYKLRTVQALGSVEEIQQKICEIVDLEIRPLEIKTLETAAETHEEEVNTVIAGGKINRITPTLESLANKSRQAAKAVRARKVAAKKNAPKEATPKAGARAAAKKTASKKKGTAKAPAQKIELKKKAVAKKAVKTARAGASKKPVTPKTVTKVATKKTPAKKSAPSKRITPTKKPPAKKPLASKKPGTQK